MILSKASLTFDQKNFHLEIIIQQKVFHREQMTESY